MIADFRYNSFLKLNIDEWGVRIEKEGIPEPPASPKLIQVQFSSMFNVSTGTVRFQNSVQTIFYNLIWNFSF